MFEEFEAEGTEEVVQNCDCYGDEVILSQNTAETEGNALQFENQETSSHPIAAVNIEEGIIDFRRWKELMDSGINID